MFPLFCFLLIFTFNKFNSFLNFILLLLLVKLRIHGLQVLSLKLLNLLLFSPILLLMLIFYLLFLDFFFRQLRLQLCLLDWHRLSHVCNNRALRDLPYCVTSQRIVKVGTLISRVKVLFIISWMEG